MASMEELSRQIPICVVVYSSPGNMRWSESQKNTESHRAGHALVLVLRRHVALQINKFRETDVGGAGSDDAADGCNVHAQEADGIGRGKSDKRRARGLSLKYLVPTTLPMVFVG